MTCNIWALTKVNFSWLSFIFSFSFNSFHSLSSSFYGSLCPFIVNGIHGIKAKLKKKGCFTVRLSLKYVWWGWGGALCGSVGMQRSYDWPLKKARDQGLCINDLPLVHFGVVSSKTCNELALKIQSQMRRSRLIKPQSSSPTTCSFSTFPFSLRTWMCHVSSEPGIT